MIRRVPNTVQVSSVSGSENLYGKNVSELQDNIKIKNNVISGISNYVKGYKDFSSNEEEQEGNYIALKFDEATKGSTVKVKVTKESTLTDDGIIVLRLKSTSIPIVVTIDNNEPQTLSLTGLTLKKEQ